MATINTCDVAGCTNPARKVRVAIDTTDEQGRAVGVVMEQDVCDLHRAGAYQSLKGQCELKIEDAIKASRE